MLPSTPIFILSLICNSLLDLKTLEVFSTDNFSFGNSRLDLETLLAEQSHKGPFKHLWTIYFPSSLLNSSENNKKWKLKKFCAIILSISDLLLYELEAKLAKELLIRRNKYT